MNTLHRSRNTAFNLDAVPDGVDPATVPKPLQPDVAKPVAAVVLFGTPNQRAMNFLNQPPLTIGPPYAAKTIKVCAAASRLGGTPHKPA